VDAEPVTVIQRSLDSGRERTEQAARGEAAATTATDVEAATRDERQPGEEPDVEELARRVYTEIKRRFAVEWERVRWRG
jgi:hypothetical protein